MVDRIELDMVFDHSDARDAFGFDPPHLRLAQMICRKVAVDRYPADSQTVCEPQVLNYRVP